MDFYINHGRLDPNAGATTEDGTPIDDWGFDGPRLEDCIGFHITYGQMRVYFDTIAAREKAQALTGWKEWDDDALEIEEDGGCLKIFNTERNRNEYFGDWGLK